MQFNVEMPASAEFATADAVRRIGQALEAAGFAGAGYTDHPAPSRKWLERGGHATLEPFAALAFLAAVTTRLRVMTYLAVLPYRNPLLTARAVATVDRLAGGRFTLVAGTGYLRSEFAALGRPFEERNQRFDEAIDVLRQVWTTDEFVYMGSDFTSIGQAFDPPPLQLPHPPIWIGGASRRARERVAAFADGWAPLMVPKSFARTIRTASLVQISDLEVAWQEVRAMAAAAGRDPARLSLQVEGAVDAATMVADAPAALENIAELERVGVTHMNVRLPTGSLDAAADAIKAFGECFVRSQTAFDTAAGRQV
jgi:probable F420-dependent oxidoreductase